MNGYDQITRKTPTNEELMHEVAGGNQDAADMLYGRDTLPAFGIASQTLDRAAAEGIVRERHQFILIVVAGAARYGSSGRVWPRAYTGLLAWLFRLLRQRCAASPGSRFLDVGSAAGDGYRGAPHRPRFRREDTLGPKPDAAGLGSPDCGRTARPHRWCTLVLQRALVLQRLPPAGRMNVRPHAREVARRRASGTTSGDQPPA